MMNASKAIRYSLLFPAFYFVLGMYLYQGEKSNLKGPQYVLYLIIGSLIVWGIGLFLGVIISSIVGSPSKEPIFYFAGQIIPILLIVSFAVYDEYSKRQHEREFGNIEHNRSVLFLDSDGEIRGSTNPVYIKIAFNHLENEFRDKNDFRLNSAFSKKRDSTIGTNTSTFISVYFVYVTKDNKTLFSKVNVFQNKATTEIFNGDPMTNQDFMKSHGTQSH